MFSEKDIFDYLKVIERVNYSLNYRTFNIKILPLNPNDDLCPYLKEGSKIRAPITQDYVPLQTIINILNIGKFDIIIKDFEHFYEKTFLLLIFYKEFYEIKNEIKLKLFDDVLVLCKAKCNPHFFNVLENVSNFDNNYVENNLKKLTESKLKRFKKRREEYRKKKNEYDESVIKQNLDYKIRKELDKHNQLLDIQEHELIKGLNDNKDDFNTSLFEVLANRKKRLNPMNISDSPIFYLNKVKDELKAKDDELIKKNLKFMEDVKIFYPEHSFEKPNESDFFLTQRNIYGNQNENNTIDSKDNNIENDEIVPG